MNLVLDIGNSRTKISVFRGSELVKLLVRDFPDPEAVKQLIQEFPGADKAIICSTKDYPEELMNCLRQEIKFVIEFSHLTPVPVKVLYHTPETLGKDRIAAVTGASLLFPGKDILVIDSGSAITYDFINSSGEYTGGNISPGLNMRFKALHHYTGRLPMVAPDQDYGFWGKDTFSAIRAGVQNGILFEMEGYIGHFKKIYKKMQVIFTGGDVNFFERKLKNSFFVDSNLVSKGLNRILEYNDKKI